MAFLVHPVKQGVGSEDLLRALHAADVKNVRQLRQAVAAPYVDDDDREDPNNAKKTPTATMMVMTMKQSHYHYLGGPCLLNAALVAEGHPPLPGETLESLMAETGGGDMESSDAAAAGIATLAAVLADHRCSSAATTTANRRRMHAATTTTTTTARDERVVRMVKNKNEEEEDIRRAFAAAGVRSASQVRRMALFGQLAEAGKEVRSMSVSISGAVCFTPKLRRASTPSVSKAPLTHR